jgi:hypothetical protein
MNITAILLICGSSLVLIAVIALYGKKTKSRYSNSELSDDEVPAEEFSKLYFQRVSQGEKIQLFAQVGNQGDCVVLQGLLQSSGIPSYTEFLHINKFYGPAAGMTSSGMNIRLYIISTDFDKALDIVKLFLDGKTQSTIKADTATLFPDPFTAPFRTSGFIVYPKE